MLRHVYCFSNILKKKSWSSKLQLRHSTFIQATIQYKQILGHNHDTHHVNFWVSLSNPNEVSANFYDLYSKSRLQSLTFCRHRRRWRRRWRQWVKWCYVANSPLKEGKSYAARLMDITFNSAGGSARNHGHLSGLILSNGLGNMFFPAQQ